MPAETNQLFINRTSNKVYTLANVVTDEEPDSPTFGVQVRTLVRLFDDFTVRIGADFEAKYRPATPEEKASVMDNYQRLAAARRPLNISELAPAFPPVRPAPLPRVVPVMSPADLAAEMEVMQMEEQNAEGQNPRRPRRGRQVEQGEPVEEIGFLVEPDARCTFDKLAVEESVKTRILDALDFINHRETLDTEWGMSEIAPLKNRCILNLVGEPGTGKTFSAKIIAKVLGKKLYQVDYSSIISKWVGDTAKHIKAAFAAAKEHDAILFWDEADSLMSRRVSMNGDAVGTSINQNRNVMMQEMDRLDGIMLTATNFFENFDPAMLRRISDHIAFPLPTVELRGKLFELHIPAAARAKCGPDVNIVALAEVSDGFSGGDILVVCENAIKSAFSESRRENRPGVLMQRHFQSAITARRQAKLMNQNGHNAGSGHRAAGIINP